MPFSRYPTVQALPTGPSSFPLISLSLVERSGGMDDVASILAASGAAIPSPSTPLPLPELEDAGRSLPNSTSSPPPLVDSESSSGADGDDARLSDYLPPSPPPYGTFTIAVTVVDEEGIIRGHILDGGTVLGVCPASPGQFTVS